MFFCSCFCVLVHSLGVFASGFVHLRCSVVYGKDVWWWASLPWVVLHTLWKFLSQELFEGYYFCQAQREDFFARAHPREGHPTIQRQKLSYWTHSWYAEFWLIVRGRKKWWWILSCTLLHGTVIQCAGTDSFLPAVKPRNFMAHSCWCYSSNIVLQQSEPECCGK